MTGDVTRVNPPVICAECGATDTACARTASNGGRVCCLGCPHVEVRVVPKREAS